MDWSLSPPNLKWNWFKCKEKAAESPVCRLTAPWLFVAVITSPMTAELGVCTWERRKVKAGAVVCVMRESYWHLWQCPFLTEVWCFSIVMAEVRCLGRSQVRLSAGINPLTSRHSRSAHSPAEFKDNIFFPKYTEVILYPCQVILLQMNELCLCCRLSGVYTSISNRM